MLYLNLSKGIPMKMKIYEDGKWKRNYVHYYLLLNHNKNKTIQTIFKHRLIIRKGLLFIFSKPSQKQVNIPTYKSFYF